MKEGLKLLDKILDKWWNVVIFLGFGFLIISLFFQITFLKPSYIFGLGLGMIMVGLSFLIAQKQYSTITQIGFSHQLITIKPTEHNLFTSCLFIIGLLVIIIFFFLILFNLIK
jgi:hypothetical protein